MNYELLRIKDTDLVPKRSYAKLVFDCDGETRYYDLRGNITTARKFENWVKREFGYLAYKLEIR